MAEEEGTETTEEPAAEPPADPPAAPAAEGEDAPTWPQGEDYDPREDPGPVRPEDEPAEEPPAA